MTLRPMHIAVVVNDTGLSLKFQIPEASDQHGVDG